MFGRLDFLCRINVSHVLETRRGLNVSDKGLLLLALGSIQGFMTCTGASAAASVSQPVSHDQEEHSFDAFIHAAFLFRAHQVKKHRWESLHQTQPGSNKAGRTNNIMLLSVS